MALDASKFDRRPSTALHRRLAHQYHRHVWAGPPSDVCAARIGRRQCPQERLQEKSIYAGITTSFSEEHGSTIAVAIRDATYLLDFIEERYEASQHQPSADEAVDFIIYQLKAYGEKHLEKIVGVAMHRHVAATCPTLCSRLWAELDIIPLVLPGLSLLGRFASLAQAQPRSWESKTIDEQAESMARKCVRSAEAGRCVGMRD